MFMITFTKWIEYVYIYVICNAEKIIVFIGMDQFETFGILYQDLGDHSFNFEVLTGSYLQRR